MTMKPAGYYFREKIADDPKPDTFSQAHALEDLYNRCLLFNASMEEIRKHAPELNLRLVLFEHGGVGYKTDKPEEQSK